MVAIRSFFILSAAAGIASAGKCKPESRSSSIVPVASSTGSASVSVIESSTTLADTTTETSLSESATETASTSGSASATIVESSTTLADTTVETSIAESTASSATSADVSTTESKLTTFLTSFTTSNADTTIEAAATTTTLAPADPTCPSTAKQCAGDSAVLCDVQLDNLVLAGFSKDILECASFCDQDDDCAGFSRYRSSGGCFKAKALIADVHKADRDGWDSGIKLTCGQNTEPTTTASTSTAETTTTEAATTTTAAAPPVDNCPPETGFCLGSAQIQCDVSLNGGSLAGGGSIAQCAQICGSYLTCTGFSRRRADGACFITFDDPVGSTENEGWDSGVVNSCAT